MILWWAFEEMKAMVSLYLGLYGESVCLLCLQRQVLWQEADISVEQVQERAVIVGSWSVC